MLSVPSKSEGEDSPIVRETLRMRWYAYALRRIWAWASAYGRVIDLPGKALRGGRGAGGVARSTPRVKPQLCNFATAAVDGERRGSQAFVCESRALTLKSTHLRASG